MHDGSPAAGATEESGVGGDDRVLPVTRLLAAVIVPFLVAAFVILFLFPDDTERLFAWAIGPPMTSMVLASAYLGGVVFFVGVLRARRWHTVRAGFLPVASFATLLGIATVLHWDRFNHTHVSFVTWAGLYFTTPFLVVAVFLANERRRGLAGGGTEVALSKTARLVIGSSGLVLTAIGVLLFVVPDVIIDVWPWTLSPLTARVMGALCTLGLAGVFVSADPRWTAARVPLLVAAVMLGFMLVSGIRSADDLDTSNPLTWVFAVGLAAMLVGIAALWTRSSREP